MQKLKEMHKPNIFFLMFYFIYFFVSYLVSVDFIKSTSRYNHIQYIKEGLTVICFLGIFLCIMVLVRQRVRLAAFMIYIFTVILINVNFNLLQLHYSYLCICLLHLMFFYQTENNRFQWFTIFNKRIHSKFMLGLFFNLTVTISGLSKCFHPGWFSGAALKFIISRNYFMNTLLGLGAMSNKTMVFNSWCILLMEIVALPLFLFRKTRLIGLIVNLLLQLGIFVFMPDIRNISIAMIIVFFYIYDHGLYSSSFQMEKLND